MEQSKILFKFFLHILIYPSSNSEPLIPNTPYLPPLLYGMEQLHHWMAINVLELHKQRNNV
jgi:hypothetical protein